MLKANSTQLRL